MKIRHVKIRNFRGISELDWAIPDSSVFCLIGKGDSTKSTILQSIRYAFYPQWNLSFDDSDFHLSQTNTPFLIEVTLGELIDEFRSLDKYGQYLRGWNKSTLTLSDEPDEGLEEVLTVRLQVEEDLEPNWTVISGRTSDTVQFKLRDRTKANVSLIGAYADRLLTWGKGSTLTHLTESDNIAVSLAGVARAAKDALEEQRNTRLVNFDAAADKAEVVARDLGVPVSYKYKAHIDINAINIKLGGLALHDGDIPLRQLGLGSRRMLVCGLQKQALAQSHITLFDEVEIGLEPYRIARLLKHIKEDTSGQYFITTHSPVVLRELNVDDLHILHNDNGKIQAIAAAGQHLEELNIQGNIRSSAEAFLAKKVLVCEGQTEVGFCRGLDNYWSAGGLRSFSFQGVAVLNAGGASKIVDIAKGLKLLLYDIAILADADRQDQFSIENATILREIGIEVLMWSESFALEDRVMMDLPWDYVLASVKLAQDEFGHLVRENVCSKLNNAIGEDIDSWAESIELRAAIGKAAKSSAWFKDISKGERWVEVILPAFDLPVLRETDLMSKMVQLREWVDRA